MFHNLPVVLALAASTFIPSTSAHSWIEEYQVISQNGSYVGNRGFSRGYIGREDPTFDGSFNSLNLLPPSDALMPDGTVRLRVNSTDNVCRDSQRTSNYTNPAYPKLKAAPADWVAMKYLENGHVTLPWNQPSKPREGGTVYVFGTSSPIEDEKLVDVMKWTKDGKGGNGRGRLLATQNFDDGRCHQINDCTNSVERQAVWPNTIPGQPGSKAELWCESNVQIPADVPAGDYTTYWIWQWPNEANVDCTFPQGKDEYYTTCADHEIIAPGPDDAIKLADAPATNTLPLEDFTSRAVATYKERQAYTTHPVILDDWKGYNVKIAQTTDSKAASFASACAASPPVAPTGIPPACPDGKWATGTLAALYSSKGIASAKSAKAERKAKATPSSPPSASAPSPTTQPSASADTAPSPTAHLTTVKSVYTTWITQTVTDSSSSSSQAPEHKSQPKPSPHRPQPPPPAVGGDGGYATIMTQAPGPQPSGPAQQPKRAEHVNVHALKRPHARALRH